MFEAIKKSPKRWLVTGCAGFIGSHLVEELLKLNQYVVGLDNFSTGTQDNLTDVRQSVSADEWNRFKFYEGDINDWYDCDRACDGIDYILHQAAWGSVPKSLDNPTDFSKNNINGFNHIISYASLYKVKAFVYASSSSVYGDDTSMPKVEHRIGAPLSPYAATKQCNELYAGVYNKCYGMNTVGLRYFNVYGPRQALGEYGAVVPKWIDSLQRGAQCEIYGTGDQIRDFTYVKDVVQANLLAALSTNGGGEVYNVGANHGISLNDLFETMRSVVLDCQGLVAGQSHLIPEPKFLPARPGDVEKSMAYIDKLWLYLKYKPEHDLTAGMIETVKWYRSRS